MKKITKAFGSLTAIAIIALVVLIGAIHGQGLAADMNEKGTFFTTKAGDVTIHTYMAPDAGFYVTSHIIEGPSQLVVVDTQQFRPHTREVVDFIKGLDKPVAKVIASHHHPDHTFGLEQMQQWPTSALPSVVKSINERGPFYIKIKAPHYGDNIPNKTYAPAADLQPGEMVIDGVRYQINEVKFAEAEHQTLITLPDQGVVIAQDLVYNKVHGYVAGNEISNWIKALQDLTARPGIKTVLCGHGEPAGPEAFQAMIQYLQAAEKAIEEAKAGSKDIIPTLTKAFPDHRGVGVLGIANQMLFKN